MSIAIGCSGGGGSAGASDSCGKLEPCGGSVVGSWKLTDGCANSAALDSEFASSTCPTATASLGSVSSSGTLTFNADMTYTMTNAAIDATLDIGLPSTCLSGASCAELGSALSAEGLTGSCTGSSSCACSATQTSFVSPSGTNDDTGTYTLSGQTIVLTSSDANADTMTMDYCVQGTFLHIVSLDTTMNTGPMGQATIDTDIVATKE